MSMTLGEVLTSNNVDAIDLSNHSLTRDGYDKARKELAKQPEKIKTGSQKPAVFDDALKDAIFKALNIALDDIIGRAWSGWSELRGYADPEIEGRSFLTLSDHTVEATHQPKVDVVIGGQTLHSFEFNVSANLEINGGELEIERGKIHAIRIGNLKVGGSISLGNQTLLEKSLAEVSIPGEMRLTNPVPIC